MDKLRIRRDILCFAAIVLIFVLGLCSMSFALAAEGELSAIDGVRFRVTDTNTGEPLSNASLSVHRRGTDDKYTIETNDDGLCVTLPLEAGSTYDIVETAAPDGYIIPLQGWMLIVGEDGAVSAKGRNFTTVNEGSEPILNIFNTSIGDGSELRRDVGEDEIPLSAPIIIGSRIDNTFLMVVGTCMMLLSVVWLVIILSKKTAEQKRISS